ITKPGLPPGDLSVPAGLAMAFPGGAGVPFEVTFAGDAGSGSIHYITADGKQIQNAPVIIAGPRHYRVTIPGFKLDFASTGHIGLALWAEGQERAAPQRTGAFTSPFSSTPLVTSASDPRPPVTKVEHEDVQLASLADARGEHRAHLNWDAMPAAVGYF